MENGGCDYPENEFSKILPQKEHFTMNDKEQMNFHHTVVFDELLYIMKSSDSGRYAILNTMIINMPQSPVLPPKPNM